MKQILAAAIATAVAAGSGTALSANSASSSCDSADPSGVLKSVGGDFEITADPQDSASNLIFIANVASGTSSVVAARISGTTGVAVQKTLTTIANNFVGDTSINGPEFVQKPNGAFGALYSGSGGVHAVFRGSVPAAWNDFKYDVNGQQATSSPPALPATDDGNYPAVQLLGENTYAQYQGACTSLCVGSLGSGTYTDLAPILAAQGLTGAGATLSPRDGYVLMTACDADNNCGVYEAQIDGAGGFVSGTLQKLASVGNARPAIAAARHPVTGTTVVFTEESATAIDVWEQPLAGGALTLVASVPSPNGSHYRTLSDNTKVVLHYFGSSVLKQGSYTLPVTAQGTALVAGSANFISKHDHGSELAWLPAVNQWALFYRVSGNALTRCWVTP